MSFNPKRKRIELKLGNGGIARLDYEDFMELDPIILPVELYESIRQVGWFYKKVHGNLYKDDKGIICSKGFIRTTIDNLAVYGFDAMDSRLLKPLEVWKQIR